MRIHELVRGSQWQEMEPAGLSMKISHTPYDGSSKPFTIGLRPLDLSRWLEVNDHRDAYLAEKRRLYEQMPDKVFVAEDGTKDAQQEVLDLVVRYFDEHFPGLIEIGGEDTAGSSPHPLYRASLMVEEDLILMRRDENGWRLVAGSLCFPSSWSLTEKFGKPLHRIHDPVPGFGTGTRSAGIIDRMFDSLQGQAVERYNWSIQANDALYHPLSNMQRIHRATSRPSKFPDGDVDAHAFLRVERQTLRKLPVSRDVLFTIGIHLDPLRMLSAHPDRAALAASLADQLEAMEEAQLDYKGLTADRDRLVERLRSLHRSVASER